MNDTLWIAMLAVLPATIGAIGALIVSIKGNQKIEAVHRATNSLQDKLVEATRLAAIAAGRLEGIAEEKARANRTDQ